MKRRDLTPARLRGRRPSVRVFEEPGADGLRRVLAYWKEGGRRRYQSYPATAAGRQQAVAFALGTFDRLTMPARSAPITTRQLWLRYLTAEEHRLRPRTVALYRDYWRKWELFIGADTLAEDVPTEAVARFRGTMAKRHAILQVRNMIRVLKTVYAWADELELITRNRVTRYRFRVGKDEVIHKPAEYRTEEWEAILRAMGGGQHARRWRAWVAVLIAGSQGARINAILRLTWADVDPEGGWIHWPRATDKVGRGRSQPLTPEARSALLTARWWARERGLQSPYVLPGPVDPSQPYDYRAYDDVLLRAEALAGVPHLPYRGSHGFRKMAAGNIRQRTGDPLLAMQWIDDQDPRMMQPYLKERAEEIAALAEPVHPATSLPPKRDVQP